ncbi:Oligopeptide transport system permease protein OppC [subsurface metagenome]
MVDSSSGRIAERKRHSWPVEFLIRLVKEKPLGTVGGVITLLLLFTGIFANFLAPYGMNETHTADALAAPSITYWLGTDNLGRDILSRVIFGARISLIVGLAATTLSTFISVIIGMLCGYIGGKLDLIVQRFVDGFMSLPWLLMLMVIMAITGTGMLPLIIAMGVLGGINGSRFPRSVVISIKENVYVEASRAIGCPTRKILSRHILPNIMAPIIISFSMTVPGVILGEAALSFLGFGVPPPAPSWGGMLSGSGRKYMFQAPWMVIWPGLALSIVVYGINMFGDAVRDLLDPRLRGGIGRYGVKAKKEATVKSEPSQKNND